MNDQQKSQFFSRMTLAVLQAGVVAKSFQGRVQNEGKQADGFESDSEIIKMKRAAKTLIDEVVQEILLLALKDILDPETITIDAEEETPSLAFFPNKDADVSIVIDPIDGTFEYLNGDDSYCVCLGVVTKGKIIMALVYYPARDVFYCIDKEGLAQVAAQFSIKGLRNAKKLVLNGENAQMRLYKNSRVSESIVDAFEKDGYEVFDDSVDNIGPPDAIIQSLSGASLGYIAHSRQMRDLLQAAIIGTARGGFVSDWEGNELVWPQSGRVPRALFGIQAYKTVIVDKMRGL